MMRFIMIFFIIVSILFAVPDCHADPVAQMPNTVNIEKQTDTSYNMLKNLLGPIVTTVIGLGDKKGTDNYGGYGLANVIDILMTSLNLCALAFLSCGILYMFGIGAITTAHEGKKIGGSVYNSLWVPVRAAFSFSLCVPVTHGYSLLQIAVLTMVGFGINFANLAWDTAGKYIVKIDVGLVSGAPSASISNEARALMEPMFRNAVTFEIVTRSMNTKLKAPDPNKFPKTATVTTGSKNRPFIIVDNPYKGTITVQMWTTENSNDNRDFGTVIIPRPLEKKTNTEPDRMIVRIESTDNSEPVDITAAKTNIAKIRANAAIDLWQGLLDHAYKYAYEKHNVIPSGGNLPATTGIALMNKYMETVNAAIKAELAKVKQTQEKIKDKLTQAIDSDGEKSMMGWATAGLFPYSLSRVHKELDEIAFTGPAEFKDPEIYVDNEGILDFSRLSAEYTNLNAAQFNAIKRSPMYLNDVVMGGSLFNDHREAGDGSSDTGKLNQIITELWWASSWSQSKDGILKTTLTKFASEDPIIVITELGGRIYRVGFWMIVAKFTRDASDHFAPLKLVKWLGDKLTPLGIAGAIVDSPLYSTVAWLLVSTGVILKFVAPLTPLAIWLYAFLGWLLRVIETLIAAPIWAVAHAMPEGHGFAGNSARQGYFMCLDVALRPILMVCGAIISIALWRIAGHGFAELATKAMNAFTGDDRDLDTQMILSIAVMVLFWVLYTKIFVALISTFPDRIMSWIGKSGGGSPISSEQMGTQFNGAMMMISNKHDALMQKAAAGLGQGQGPKPIGGKNAINSENSGHISPGIQENMGNMAENQGNDTQENTNSTPSLTKSGQYYSKGNRQGGNRGSLGATRQGNIKASGNVPGLKETGMGGKLPGTNKNGDAGIQVNPTKVISGSPSSIKPNNPDEKNVAEMGSSDNNYGSETIGDMQENKGTNTISNMQGSQGSNTNRPASSAQSTQTGADSSSQSSATGTGSARQSGTQAGGNTASRPQNQPSFHAMTDPQGQMQESANTGAKPSTQSDSHSPNQMSSQQTGNIGSQTQNNQYSGSIHEQQGTMQESANTNSNPYNQGEAQSTNQMSSNSGEIASPDKSARQPFARQQSQINPRN